MAAVTIQEISEQKHQPAVLRIFLVEIIILVLLLSAVTMIAFCLNQRARLQARHRSISTIGMSSDHLRNKPATSTMGDLCHPVVEVLGAVLSQISDANEVVRGTVDWTIL
ncbi:MAG: hypothetical protein ACRYG8_10800 [Janthinobacterium lividum]